MKLDHITQNVTVTYCSFLYIQSVQNLGIWGLAYKRNYKVRTHYHSLPSPILQEK